MGCVDKFLRRTTDDDKEGKFDFHLGERDSLLEAVLVRILEVHPEGIQIDLLSS